MKGIMQLESVVVLLRSNILNYWLKSDLPAKTDKPFIIFLINFKFLKAN